MRKPLHGQRLLGWMSSKCWKEARKTYNVGSRKTCLVSTLNTLKKKNKSHFSYETGQCKHPALCQEQVMSHLRLREAKHPGILWMLPNHKICKGKSSSSQTANSCLSSHVFPMHWRIVKAKEITSVNKSELQVWKAKCVIIPDSVGWTPWWSRLFMIILSGLNSV